MFNKEEVKALYVIIQKSLVLESKIAEKKGKCDIKLIAPDGKLMKIGKVSTIGPAFSMVVDMLSRIAHSVAEDAKRKEKIIQNRYNEYYRENSCRD